MKREKHLWLVIIGFISILMLTIGGWLYYNLTMREVAVGDAIDMQNYNKHYVLIRNQRNEKFWEEIYEAASQAAYEKDAYLEVMQNDLSTDYTTDEFLKMSIAAKVDGIILEHTGSEKTQELMNEALRHHIPVVTVIEDAPYSQRVSFVGANNYMSGQMYGEYILQIINEDTKKITVLTNGEMEQNKNIHTQINAVLVKNGYAEEDILVETENLGAKGAFDIDNIIRNHILTPQSAPDILVCLDEISTESAYQAIIDNNLVGITRIIGYYASPTALEGLEQGVIPIIFELKADEIGRKSIEALHAFSEDGRTNEFHTIGLNVIDENTIEEYIQSDAYEENE